MRTMTRESLIKRLEKVKKELIRINQGQEALLIEEVINALTSVEASAPVLSEEPGKPVKD